MINLVPPDAKKRITTEYWIRVVTVWLWLLAVSVAVGATFLLPVFVLIDAQISAYKDSADQAVEKIASFENVSLELNRSTMQAQLIMGTDQYLPLSTLVEQLRDLEGQGVALSEIAIARAEAGIAPVVISGIAADRRSLSNFRDRLLAHEQVEAVDFPISNLAKDKDISFSMTVTIANTPRS